MCRLEYATENKRLKNYYEHHDIMILTPLRWQAIKEIIGVYEDIPAPDMNTDARVMAWFFGE
jgi:glutamate dehydrogenase/leucine dehydrogenase